MSSSSKGRWTGLTSVRCKQCGAFCLISNFLAYFHQLRAALQFTRSSKSLLIGVPVRRIIFGLAIIASSVTFCFRRRCASFTIMYSNESTKSWTRRCQRAKSGNYGVVSAQLSCSVICRSECSSDGRQERGGQTFQFQTWIWSWADVRPCP